ncbi:S41 family peptidase [Marinilabiliaceae bacterium ANBcel2]|nr:S41 family peptidase [Marinilabiliaceae bacterium ANBcel2]
MQYNNSFKKVILPLLFAVVLAAGFFGGAFFSQSEAVSSGNGGRMFVYPGKSKVGNLLEIIEQQYVDSINISEIEEKIIPDILEDLDPHSVYIPEDKVELANQELDGEFGGIGVQFNMQNDTVMVISVVSGGPSEEVGIVPGDRIITVNDSLIAGEGIPTDQVVSMLRGEMGTVVNVGVERRGREDLIDFEITRGSIPVHSVDISYMIEDAIGYIKISRFARNTYQEFITGLSKLKSKGSESVIIDLRGNSGGYLDVAINMINEILAKDELIVYTEGKAVPRQDVYANGSGSFQDIGITVLIDEFSASASEILAGAVQDNDRGLVIGRRSFGKGLVQQQMSLTDGSAVRLTVARYYIPSGRGIQKPYDNGIEDYYRDILSRFEHGEFYEKDSIVMNDSLRYETKGGRVVYGGGGVMPDIFVPRDTTYFNDLYFTLRDRGLIYQFALRYSDDNRDELSSFEAVKDLYQHLSHQNILDSLLDFIEERGVDFPPSEFEESKDYISTEVNAYIARNIMDEEGFYPILHKIDEIVIAALEAVKKGYDHDPFSIEEIE